MGNCVYCGKPAGFLKSRHSGCKQKYQSGKQRISIEALRVLNGSESFDTLVNTVNDVERSCFVPPADTKTLLINAWEASIEQFLNDGVLDKGEDDRLIELQKRFYLTQEDLDRRGAFSNIGKASILRDVLNGEIPQRRVEVTGPYAVNLRKGERIIWAFSNSKFFEDKISREYVGGSQGISVRVMKGVYYRIGQFKGHTVEQTKLVYIDTGFVILTNKHIYFNGPRQSIRVPYTKIVAFQPFSDGIGVILDNAKSKRQIFLTGDGWFTYNLVSNISRI